MSKIVSLQYLRGFAATVVAGYHLYAAAENEGFSPGFFSVFSGGGIGVDIFFVISGFIICYIAICRADMTRNSFVKARFWRIFPSYWAILTLYILAALAMYFILSNPSGLPSASSVFVSYLLLPYPDHVIVIAWTLSLEILFYIVFAASYFNGGLRRLILWMVFWVIAAQIFTHLIDQKPLWLVFILHNAVLEFLFGILIAIYYTSTPPGKTRFHMPAFIIGSALTIAYLVLGGWKIGPLGREISAGIPAALLIYGAVGLTLKEQPVFETWGESSYTLYLVHILYFSMVGIALEISFGINVYASQIYMFGMLLSVVFICYMITVYVERPYQKWYRRFIV